eukprot:Seg3410.3 transcript_id=Seg3410.3/GoldUCD/mRNA.D3Y31 product="hypothetical protein" protein_id=Seg3410.3/GoldUCD/D3Y31
MAERMNGYIYDGSKSLRTTDGCLKGPLLKSYKHDSKISLEYEMIHAEGRSFVATVDNVLNPEQCKEIIANSKQENFKSMLEKYRYCQRNNSRVLILDDAFSSTFWETLEPAVNAILTDNSMPTRPLGFDVSRGDWKLHSLNSGFRINKYTAEERQFFSPHKDAQYCPNGDRRSLLTVLVFLNGDFEGGLTKFYFPKRSDEEIISKGICKDKTVDEEIRNFGGLEEGYNSFTIKPSVGKAVIFSQNILHESTLLEKKTKYILKTDVMVNQQDKSYGFVVSEDEKVDYLQCLNLFREAQSLELAREKEKAGDLYERALSIRYCYPMALNLKETSTQHKNIVSWNNYVLPGIVWYRIFDFLSGKDIESFIRAYPEFSMEQKVWEQRRFKRDERSFSENPLYMPNIESQYGIYTKLRFKDTKFFFDNEEACIRVAAMYSFYLLGHKAEDQFYTVRYNPDTQEIYGVALKSLLRDVFLNRPCYGAIYSVMQQDPDSKNIAEDFEASVDRSYMTIRHGAQFVGGAIGDEMKVRVHVNDVSEEDLAKVIEETSVEREQNEQQSFRSSYYVREDGRRVWKVRKDSEVDWSVYSDQWDLQGFDSQTEREMIIEALKDSLVERLPDGIAYSQRYEVWVRQSIAADLMRTLRKYGDQIMANGVFDHLREFTNILEDDGGDASAKELYMDETISICRTQPGVSAAVVFNRPSPTGDEEREAHCMCYYSDLTGRERPSSFRDDLETCCNHLVFDFATHQLVISKDERGPHLPITDPKEQNCMFYKCGYETFWATQLRDLIEVRNYIVGIAPILQDGIGFNHASCECQIPEFVMDECKIVESYPSLNHIHVLGGVDVESNEVVMWTVYGGIVAM